MKRVVIVGMGFGGIRAAAELAGQKDVEVLVIDRRNFHLFQPLLYQVATASLDQEAIAYSIRALVRKWPNVNYQMSEVTDIDFQNKCVLTDDNSVPFDYLILAPGSVTNFFGVEAIQKNAFDLKKLDDAVSLRNHILTVFEDAVTETDPAKRQAMLNFVIVGGGPTGVEFAGALSELIRNALTKDFKGLPCGNAKIILIESNERVLKSYPAKLSRYALHKLERMGVEIRLKNRVTDATSEQVTLKDGTVIPTRTMFWAAGVRSAPLADKIPVTQVQGGRIPVQDDLTLKDHPDVFVIGDMMYKEQDGQPLPGVSPVAMQGGAYAAHTILARGTDKKLPPFHYFDKGTMAVIGRSSAVADVFGVQIQGFFAWVTWLFIHIFYLIGFRNRVLTLLNWMFTYILSSSQIRLITRESKDPAA